MLLFIINTIGVKLWLLDTFVLLPDESTGEIVYFVTYLSNFTAFNFGSQPIIVQWGHVDSESGVLEILGVPNLFMAFWTTSIQFDITFHRLPAFCIDHELKKSPPCSPSIAAH